MASLVEQDAIAAAVVGVTSLPVALDLWHVVFGFEIIAQQTGADASLESFWQLPRGSITAQALLGTAGIATGRVWLVEFAQPAPPVRQGAATIDLCPKSLNLAPRDLPARYKEMLARGLSFRSPWVNYPAGAFDVNEVQLLAHDGLNLGLLEKIGVPFAFNERGYAGITNFVAVVEDIDAETAFYREIFGLELIGEHRLRGEKIEKLIGLPAGAVVAMNIFGARANPYGQMQLVAYQGAQGMNRYSSARPPACGQLHPVWLTERLNDFGCDTSQAQTIHTLLGTVEAIRIQTPSGMMTDIFSLE